MNNADKIRELLNKAKAVYAGYGTNDRYMELLSYLDKALSLLPCETCNETGYDPEPRYYGLNRACPDCKGDGVAK